IDTLRIAKREFRFDSNKLEYIAKVLGVEEKDQHKEFPGFELWAECMAGNPKAWKEMRLYNVQDVITLEQVYLKLRPWATNHPNVMVNKDSEEHACPKCGGTHLHRRGYQYTNTGKYQRYQCTDCGGWSRTRYTENTKEVRKSLLTNAV
ncbi:MAG: ribonuclease H-like domain-containing protein, partial [Bacteroidota bacterium]